ncbi:MAG TPA: CoA transferase [Mycobacteriales bacterium]|nr:CoA transferase [Mycobacteriales bacterium]
MTEGPLAGLTAIDLSRSLSGAMATQLLADAGADVLLVEPPGGLPIRTLPSWPALGRGKGSIVLDLAEVAGRGRLDDLIHGADVLVTTSRPSTIEHLGLTPERLRELNPRLVSASITGWGSTGPLAHLKGYEGLVMAKLGFFHVKRRITDRPGPAFASIPYASWGAAQTAVHGILAALYERETSGVGQHVEADLVRGVHTLDTWQWFTELIGVRWPDAYTVADAFDEKGQILAPLVYALTIAPTSDGTWLQFAQVQPRLFLALMQEIGLGDIFTDPKWAGVPVLPTQELRTELWELMIRKVGERTRAEWEAVFARNPDVFAEVFRTGAEVLDHPQLVHDGRVAVVDDPELGPVRQPSTLAFAGGRPLTTLRPAPRLGEHALGENAAPAPASSTPDPTTTRSDELPLAGVTVLELGLMFAAPFGATLLADLGARVIKVESLEGDTIRRVQPFPESGGAKVLQGKESIALDLSTDEGRRIVHELAARSDIVLQSFRAGAPERAGVDAATLCAINPDLIYVNAPGYGTDGPYGAKPAYAPSIGAAGGVVLTDAAHAVTPAATVDEIKRTAMHLMSGGTTVPLQADGIAALGVASTMLLGLLARARGRALPPLTATMLGTNALANLDHTVTYAGRPAGPSVDPDYLGFGALYRMYETAAGWVFLAAPVPDEWDALVAALAGDAPLGDDARFATASLRREHDTDLAEVLAKAFATKTATQWEAELTAAGVGCVEVHEDQPQKLMLTDPALAEEYTTTTTGPVFDEYPRLTSPTRFSRSRTQARGFCLAGEQTDAILTELGYDASAIADLRARNIVTG